MNPPDLSQPASTQPLRRLAMLHCLAWIMAIGLLPIKQSLATSGDKVTLPLTNANKPGYSKDNGLQVIVDSTWAGNRGYRPIRVTVSSAKPVTGDTQLTIRFMGGTWRSGDRSISVEHDFELAQGASSVQARFLVPQHTDWNTTQWDVWVDGVKDEDLCMSMLGFSAGSNGAVSVGRFDLGTAGWQASGTSLVQSVSANAVEEQAFDLSNLPDSWLEYSSLDVVTTTPNVLEFARVSAPERLAHLLRWVRTGGNLWVLGVGSDYDQLEQVEGILFAQGKPEPGDDTAEIDTAETALDRWNFLKFSEKGRQRLQDIVTLTMDVADDGQQLSRAEIADSRFPDTATDSRRWFVAREYGLGTVLALKDGGGNGPQKDAVVTTLQRSAITDNLNWSLRHGNDPGTGNPNFNHWLIADVGAAPVFAFQMLITLFAIAIGPVNYWLLKRKNQLPLMLLTVPTAALVATVLLFVYGFLADGISTRVRARTLTTLDQVEGELASWGRLSYYAGIAPPNGLEMPKGTAVYPILPSRSEYSAFGGRQVRQQRVVEWQQQQRLTRGWLGSRTPTQYLTVTAQPTKKQLIFNQDSDSISVENSLGTDVLALVVQDHQGNLFFGENIDTEGTAEVSSSNFVEASAKLRQYFSESLLQLPPGYIEGRRSRRRDYGSSMTESLMELNFEAMSIPQASGWGNGTYIAITANAIELSLGLPDIDETESFHVVRGTW